MSIYSGFATRHQQQQYDSYVQRMLHLLQKLVCQIVQQTSLPNKFRSSFSRIFMKMKQMEQYKYLKPKMTKAVEPLFKVLQEQSSFAFEKNNEIQITNNNISIMDILPQKPSFSHQKDLIMQYQAQASRRSQNFRTKRPITTKYSSATKTKPSVVKFNSYNPQIDRIRSDANNYLGRIPSSISKTQNYFRTFNNRQRNHGSIFISNKIAT